MKMDSLLQSRIRCASYKNRMSAMALLDYVGKSAMKLCAGVMEVPRMTDYFVLTS